MANSYINVKHSSAVTQAIPLLGIYLKEMKTCDHKRTFTRTFLAALSLFIMASDWGR